MSSQEGLCGNKTCLYAAVTWMQRILVDCQAGSICFSVASGSTHTYAGVRGAFSRELQLLLSMEHSFMAFHHPTQGLNSSSVIHSPS